MLWRMRPLSLSAYISPNYLPIERKKKDGGRSEGIEMVKRVSRKTEDLDC